MKYTFTYCKPLEVIENICFIIFKLPIIDCHRENWITDLEFYIFLQNMDHYDLRGQSIGESKEKINKSRFLFF